MNIAAPDSETPKEPRRRSFLRSAPLRSALFAATGVLVLFAGLAIADVDDVIDLPAWADIDGIDVPLIGNNDQIGCRIQQVAGTNDIEISIFDGDESTYDEYVHVFTHGDFLDDDQVERPAPDTFITPAVEDVDTQFFFISTEPSTVGRLWCGSIPSS